MAQKSTRFEIGEIQVGLRFSTDIESVDVGGTVDLKNILLAIQGGDGDGFLNKILPKDPIEIRSDIGVDISLRKGLHFRGNASFEVTIPLHVDLFGVLKIDSLYIAFRTKDVDGVTTAEIILAATARIEIASVIKGTVSRIGLKAIITFPQEVAILVRRTLRSDLNLPDGAGLSIDASILVGGGYLSFDSDKEQYAGNLIFEYQR